MVAIGEMRERVTIQTATLQADSIGGATPSWSDVDTVWARVEPLSGSEGEAQDQLQSSQLYRITIRYRNDITAAHRITWRGTAMNIRALANPDERRHFLEMRCESGVAN